MSRLVSPLNSFVRYSPISSKVFMRYSYETRFAESLSAPTTDFIHADRVATTSANAKPPTLFSSTRGWSLSKSTAALKSSVEGTSMWRGPSATLSCNVIHRMRASRSPSPQVLRMQARSLFFHATERMSDDDCHVLLVLLIFLGRYKSPTTALNLCS
jgi:hypothetical protein